MQNASNIVFLGLGSNLDDPSNQLKTAINFISDENKITILKQSSFYKTKPFGYLEQNDFVNAVLQIKTSLTCAELLKTLQSIEQKQKRLKTWHWGPRTIDIDILCYGDLVLDTPKLRIPHPGIKERIFVLQPWAEIAPEWILPDGSVIQDLYQELVSYCDIKAIW